jgi:hypothetical protein
MTTLHAAGILYELDEVELDRRIEAAIARTRETLAEAAAPGSCRSTWPSRSRPRGSRGTCPTSRALADVPT